MSKLRNKIPSTCYRCGEECAEGEGHVELVTDVHYNKWPNAKLKKWLVQHTECAIEHRGTRTHYIYAPTRAKRVAPTGATEDEEVLSGSSLSEMFSNMPEFITSEN